MAGPMMAYYLHAGRDLMGFVLVMPKLPYRNDICIPPLLKGMMLMYEEVKPLEQNSCIVIRCPHSILTS